MTKRILITPGEPAGIGPDITIQIAQLDWAAELVVVADTDMLLERAAKLNLPLKLTPCNMDHPPVPHQKGHLYTVPVELPASTKKDMPAIAGKLQTENAKYVIDTLNIAAFLCQEKKAQAIVTGPVNKEILNKAGIPFTGHTEFFAQYCQAPHTVMLFVVDQLKVALASTHVALANVPASITQDSLRTTLLTLYQGLQQLFQLQTPHVLVCGLNPHAGEGGYLGREEIDVIAPVIEELRAKQYSIEGPLPADTIFTSNQLRRADAVLAMYHDQALPLIKYIGFGHAVNVTLGLPFVRTSVDHGTAIDVAGTGTADPGSMAAAIELAIITSATPPSSGD